MRMHGRAARTVLRGHLAQENVQKCQAAVYHFQRQHKDLPNVNLEVTGATGANLCQRQLLELAVGAEALQPLHDGVAQGHVRG